MAGDFSGKPLEFGCRFESVDVRETELWNGLHGFIATSLVGEKTD